MTSKRANPTPADEPDQAPPAAEPRKAEQPRPPVVEQVPSLHGQISALASANAPFIHFDGIPTVGLVNGVARITLTAERMMLVLPDNSAIGDHAIVAHLRCSLADVDLLRSAVAKIDRMALEQTQAMVAAAERPAGPAH